MQRILTSADLGEGRTRYSVRIESDACDLNSGLIEHTKQVLMSNFADNPHLLHCGPVPFQRLKMAHNGEIWIVEAEGIQESPNAKDRRSIAASP